ncbi:structural maintenance of chromosomes protein 6 [Drosophila guanche]|uniref:Blast:Structural maintenance of chromosomes protein 6 n=1 Tax=Drosophila guanche TaxID=7266 RepID=A0A3B0K3Z0_DROGU|nr:structural maintenance of chromosomes protein 6 [Drosophila guanche]SPP82690.1 blast:Structural maintenance of chromosomes protein 6 [Drosophila guanche]
MENKRKMSRKLPPESDGDSSFAEPTNKKSKSATNQDESEQDMSRILAPANCSRQSTDSRSSQRSYSSFNLSCEPQLPNEFNRCGKVISIHLENFMCHESFTVDFGPNTNFLVGKNGSGKSAVITALSLGLAGNARATSRAASIKKLIKNGETSAKIEITLCNVGMCPFDAEHMGPHLTVVRHIRQSSSTYELKDARGKIVSKKLDDVKRLLRRFSIHVENPIFVLNQDSARVFLKKLEPSSNFTLLMKATQMDTCASALSECLALRQKQARSLEHFKMRMQVAEGLVMAEEEKLAALRDKEAVKFKLAEANTKLAWLSVAQKEKELASCEHSIQLVEVKKAKLVAAATQKDSTQVTLTQQLSNFEEKKRHNQDVHRSHEARMREATRILQEQYLKACSIRTQMKNAEKRLNEDEHEYEACEKHISNYHADYARIKREREELATRAVELKQLVAEREALVKQVRQEQLERKERYNAVREQVDTQRFERNKLNHSKQNIQTEIETLGRNKSNKLSIYGEQAIKVDCALRSQYTGPNQHRMPRGPLGQYITAVNPKYRDLVENQLSSCLRSYIVSSDKERQALRALLQRFHGNNMPTIITSAFTNNIYNVSKFKVQATTPNTTVLIDEISCDDPVVMNYLIDSLRIETVLVTESKETAEFLTSDTENVPPNLTRVLVPGLGLEYIPSPNYAVYSARILPGRYMQVNVDDRIRQLQDMQRSLQERAASINTDFQTLRETLERTGQEVAQKTTEISQCLAEVQKASQEIIEIESTEHRDLPEYDRLKTHLADCAERIEKCKEERRELQLKLEAIDERKAKYEAMKSDELKALQELSKQMESIDTEAHEVTNRIRTLDSEYSLNSRHLQTMVELVENQQRIKQELLNELEKMRHAAKLMGEFISTNETEEELQDLISRHKSRIRQVEQLNYDAEEVEKGLAVLRYRLAEDTNRFERTDSVIRELRTSYRNHALNFQKSRTHYLTMVQYSFQNSLSLRHFNATFESNIRAKTWSINVFPASGNKTTNAKSLSGGERSFTTVSLLKGLWTTSDHPFYFLDEYDVFTDEVNRKFITEMLIKEGEDLRHRQYCFLTPLDTAVEESPYIRILKLSSPDEDNANEHSQA